MRSLATLLFIAIIVPSLISCGGAAEGNIANVNNSNTIMTRTAAPPTSAVLTAQETSAYEAWKNKNGSFFEDFLTTGFITFGPAGRMDKAAAIKDISESQCVVNSYSIAEGSTTVMGNDGAVFTFKATTDGTCGSEKIPSPTWGVTVYLRDMDKWKAAYHNEVPAAGAGTASPAQTPSASTTPAAAAPGNSPENSVDPLTQTLMATEKKAWEARKTHDLKGIAEVTLLDLVYIDAAGNGPVRRDEAAKLWMGPDCKISSYSLSEPLARPIAMNASLLTYKATLNGNCGTGSAKSIWGTTLYMKEGGGWKALLIFNRPA